MLSLRPGAAAVRSNVRQLPLLLVLTFIESFATICVERGVYFYTHDVLLLGDVWNLWMALALGVGYIFGALSSHRCCLRFGERPVLLAMLAGQAAVHLAMAWLPLPIVIFIGAALLGPLNGMKWPVVESYVSAGRTGVSQARSIGWFNVSWAVPVVLSLVVAGPLLARYGSGFFVLPAAINIAALLMALRLPAQPVHVLHMEQAAVDQHRSMQDRLRPLLTSHRWLLLASYTAMFLLAPLMPGIFKGLKVPAAWSPAASSIMDVFRVATFVALGLTVFWHGRVSIVWLSLASLTAGLFLVLFGADLAAALGGGIAMAITWVILGQVLFGLSSGMIYYGALYYAMVVQNASVEGGGAHEGLIGGGFALGPLAGLIAVALAPHVGGNLPATFISVGPMLAVCFALSLWPLRKPRG